MNKINLGIVGFGGFGRFIYQALTTSDYFSVEAIADESAEKSTIPTNVKFVRKWKDLVSSPEVDVVFISTPPSSHEEIAMESLRNHKHVIIEKPIATTTKGALAIQKLAEELDKIVMVDFLQRFNPILEVLQNIYSQGYFGNFERYLVENYAQDETLDKNHWFWDRNISGGILIEHAVHFIDIVHWFNKENKSKSIHGYCDSRNSTQMDRMCVNVLYENGLLATHTHGFTRPLVFERTNMRFVFSTAQFDLDGWIPQSGRFTLLANDELMSKLESLPGLKISTRKEIHSVPVRGINYDYPFILEGSFKSELTKSEIYSRSIQKIFEDFYRKLNSSGHKLRVSLDDAVRAVHIAQTATESATYTHMEQ